MGRGDPSFEFREDDFGGEAGRGFGVVVALLKDVCGHFDDDRASVAEFAEEGGVPRVVDCPLAGEDETVAGRGAGRVLDVNHGDVGEGRFESLFEREFLELKMAVVVVDLEVIGVDLLAETGGLFGEVEGGADVGFDGDGGFVFFGELGPRF